MIKMKIKLFLLFALFAFPAFAQITVVSADKGPAANGDGLYYSLPATVFKVEVDLQRTEEIPGPLADFCEDYLGTNDYIKDVSTAYKAVNVRVTPITVTDEKAKYYMVFSEKSSKDEKPPLVELTPLGTLKSVNIINPQDNKRIRTSKEIDKTIIINQPNDRFNYEARFNRKQLIDTIVRKITIDTMTISRFLFRTSWVAKTKQEQAQDAAHRINTIREQRMNLLTGYHEINFGNSTEYMDGRLKDMEQQYLQLFQGKKQVSLEHYTFLVKPEKNDSQKLLLETKDGKKLLFHVKASPSEQIKPMDAILNNIIYYRTPVNAIIDVTFDDKSLFKDIFPVDQLGVITGVSVYKAGVVFDKSKGVPVKIVKF